MVAYTAIYHNGRLELREPVNLAEGAEVRVIVLESLPAKPLATRTVPSFPASHLLSLAGIVSAGGDALKDSEALYDGD